MAHLKRINTPRTWKIARKENVFITKPNPGMHSLNFGMSLVAGMRDSLKLGRTRKEIRDVLNNKEVLVDRTRRKDHKFNIGFMDSISLPNGKNYRVTFSTKGKLSIIEIDEKESKLKIVRIVGKTPLKGKIQYNLDDGRNFTDENKYKVSNSLLIELPSQKVKEVYVFEKGASIMLIGGRHIGTVATIENVDGDVIVFKTENKLYETHKKNAMVVGKEKTAVKIQ